MDTLNATSLPKPLALFRGETASPAVSNDAAASPSDLPAPTELLSLFEEITGWVVEFEETAVSRRARKNAAPSAAGSTVAPKGHFSIVDMSASWPPGRPTSHRAKCDRFIKILDELIQNSQRIDDELLRLRSFVAIQQNAIEDSQEVIDSFAPRCPYLTQAERDGDFELNSELEIDLSLAPDDEGHHATSAENPPSPPRDQRENNLSTRLQSLTGTVESEHSSGKSCRWQIGGRRGLVDNRYIDWALRKDQRIELIVGQIEALDGADDEAANQEWESKLILNPETRRYWFSVEPRARFWVFDGATRQLNRIVELSRIGQLEPSQALVITTANLPETLVIELGEAVVWGNESIETADDLAQTLQEALELTEPLLVLQRVS